MKLFGPPTILEPSVITTEECSDMYQQRAYIYKGRTIKIEPNTIISIPMIVHGSVTHDEINVYCNGAKFTIDGKQHSNMLSFETVRLSMVDLSIQVGDQDIQELLNITSVCIGGIATYS